MDTCSADVITEFLAVAFHSILYYTTVYPKSIFEPRKKYSVVVYHSIHPEVNEYIDLCLKTIAESFRTGVLHRVDFSVTDQVHKPVLKFVFDFSHNEDHDHTIDAYLVQAEQNLRAFCLNLSCLSEQFKDMPEDSSFTIHIHTNESTAVSLANNPNLEDFPLIEIEGSDGVGNKIVPIRQFTLRSYNVDTYMEKIL